MDKENDEEVKNKEELEAELLEVRKEIQWREREQEEFNNTAFHLYVGAGIILALFLLLVVLLGGIGVIIWFVVSFFVIKVIVNSFEKTKEGKRVRKATQELAELKKRKTELEKKLDNLEEETKKLKRKGKLSK